MDKEEFERNLLLYGRDLSIWPDATGARQLLDSDPEARDLMAEINLLDDALARVLAPKALDGSLPARILEAAAPPKQTLRVPLRFAAAALAVGAIGSGFALGQAVAVETARSDAMLIALASGHLPLPGEVP